MTNETRFLIIGAQELARDENSKNRLGCSMVCVWALLGFSSQSLGQPQATALEVAELDHGITGVVCTAGDASTWGHVVWTNQSGASRIHEWWLGQTSLFEVPGSPGESVWLRHVPSHFSFGAVPCMKLWQVDGDEIRLRVGSGVGSSIEILASDSFGVVECIPAQMTQQIDGCPGWYHLTIPTFGTNDTSSPECSVTQPCTAGHRGIVLNQSIIQLCDADVEYRLVSPGFTPAPGNNTFWNVLPHASLSRTQLGGLPARVAFAAKFGPSATNYTTGLFIGTGPDANGVASFELLASPGLTAPGLSGMTFTTTSAETPSLNEAGAIAFTWKVAFDNAEMACLPYDVADSLWLRPRTPTGGATPTPVAVVFPGKPIPLAFDSGATFVQSLPVTLASGGQECEGVWDQMTYRGADVGWHLNANDELAFIADYCTDAGGGSRVTRSGVFISKIEGGQLITTPIVALPGNPSQNPIAPGAGGARFSSFGYNRVWINNAGNIAFQAELDDNRVGIWVARPGIAGYIVELWLITGQTVSILGSTSTATLVNFVASAAAGSGGDGRNIVFNDQRMFVVSGTLNSSEFPTQNTRFAAIAVFPSNFPPSSCDPDLNGDGNVDQDDVAYLINVIGGGDNPNNIDPDFNQDGNVDQDDIAAIVDVVGGGNCP